MEQTTLMPLAAPTLTPILGSGSPKPVTLDAETNVGAAPTSSLPAGPLTAPRLEPSDQAMLDFATSILGDHVLDTVDGYRLPAGFKLSVVMPVFNEKRTIAEIVRRVQAVELPKELIIIDDCSTDGTRDMLAELERQSGVRVYYHPANRGKGAAVRTGISQATGDVVLIQDADLEYDPQEYVRLIRPIVEDHADVVYGSRFLDGRAQHQLLRHRLANSLLTRLSNFFTRLNLTDMETCHKVFRRSLLTGLNLEQERFGIEPELTAKIARRGARVVEVPIGYRARSAAEGKKIKLRDAFNALYCIARYSLGD
jgi:glycosyltransferase involved in cell wall biosynthesis